MAETAAGEYSDIDDAWNDVTSALAAEGIGIADVPIYLILGRAAAGDDAFIQSAEQQIVVRSPSAAEAPLRLYANRDAIFVTCAGASACGRKRPWKYANGSVMPTRPKP